MSKDKPAGLHGNVTKDKQAGPDGNVTEDELAGPDGNYFQLHQDESTTKTKATGGIETDTRTSGDYKHGQDNICDFQQG